jgi:transposase-like protein
VTPRQRVDPRGQRRRDLRPVYTAVNATAARASFDELAEKWGSRYPAIVRLCDNAWQEFIPFLDYDVGIEFSPARAEHTSCLD